MTDGWISGKREEKATEVRFGQNLNSEQNEQLDRQG